MGRRLIWTAAGLGACSAVLVTVTAVAATPAPVRLLAPRAPLRGGRTVAITVENRSSVRILRALCLVLQRRGPRGWETINRTHGAYVGCPPTGGVPQPARSRQEQTLVLYDDLRPGLYRATLVYRPWPSGNVGQLRGAGERSVSVLITIGAAAHPSHHPRLTEKRILSLAEAAARSNGDPHPTLIQHAEGTRFDANRLGGGDLVFEWNWSYLIAVRGHFAARDFTGPPGARAPRGSVITLVVDAASGRVTDFGLSSRYPDLAKLGPVSTDLR